MASKNKRVNSFSLFLFFCHAGEILVEREKKLLHNPAIQSRVSIVFREQQKGN